MHYLTVPELIRWLENQGHTNLAEVVRQVDRRERAIRVDLEALLRKPDDSKGSLPPA